jgi:hypothetical protein
MPLMERPAVVQSLRSRLANLDVRFRDQLAQQDRRGFAASHVAAMADLWMGLGATEREWLVDLVRRVDRGDFDLKGEPARWQAPADDPGWQMAADRNRYLELMSRQR